MSNRIRDLPKWNDPSNKLRWGIFAVVMWLLEKNCLPVWFGMWFLTKSPFAVIDDRELTQEEYDYPSLLDGEIAELEAASNYDYWQLESTME